MTKDIDIKKPELDKKFIVNLKGNDFVTYNGLIDLAHQIGIKEIKTELLQIPTKENEGMAIVKAVVKTLDDKTFEGIGDADNKSVNSMIANHKIRMAETRAKARALRDLTNVGMTALEELGEDEDVIEKKGKSKYKSVGTEPSKASGGQKNTNLATDKQLGFVNKLLKDKKYTEKSIDAYIQKAYGKKNLSFIDKKEASEIIEMLTNLEPKE